MAETVAMAQTMGILYCVSQKGIVKGNKNKHTPVILFDIVCNDTIFFRQRIPHILLPILITVIMPAHIHNHFCICITGKILNKDTVKNVISAIVSKFAPNLLTVFVLLAMVPSTMSVNPQIRYMIQK